MSQLRRLLGFRSPILIAVLALCAFFSMAAGCVPTIAEDDSYIVEVGGSVTINPLWNDMLNEGNLLFPCSPEGYSISVTSMPDIGNLTQNGNELVYTAPSRVGPIGHYVAFIEYEIVHADDDAGKFCGGGSTAWVDIEAGDSLPPVRAVRDRYSVVQGEAFSRSAAEGVTSNDRISGILDYDVAIDGTYAGIGDLDLWSDGAFTYTPAPGFIGFDNFRYLIMQDGDVLCEGRIIFDVSPSSAPLAVDDEFALTGSRSPLEVLAPGVLGNDPVAAELGVTALLRTMPANGDVTLEPDGSFTYYPDSGFTRVDTFAYAASNTYYPGLETFETDPGWGVVTIKVLGPLTAADDRYVVLAGEPLVRTAANGVLFNDDEPSGLPLTVIPLAPPSGSLTLNTDGSFTYQSAEAGNVTTTYDSFTYSVTNGEDASDPAVVTIEILPNPAPRASEDFFSVGEGDVLFANPNGVLLNDDDVYGIPLFAELISGTQHGELTFRSNGTFDYEPDAGFTGNDTFTYRAKRPGSTIHSEPATTTIQVIPAGGFDALPSVPGATARASSVLRWPLGWGVLRPPAGEHQVEIIDSSAWRQDQEMKRPLG
ncbi:MAG: tandem-95 repeat protein [SAR202 cluster bacterium]|nr:tandem-95 repeat protein [SAR202 cluster bacterium]